MSEPYVSSYDDVFMAAFSRGIQQIPQDQAKLIKLVTDKIFEAVTDNLHYYVSEEMKANLDGEIRSSAAAVAQSMLMNAIAGDDKQIRNLFGFNDWYMKHLYVGRELPTQWKLIDALIERKPELFINEKLAQQAAEIDSLRNENERLKLQIEDYRDALK